MDQDINMSMEDFNFSQRIYRRSELPIADHLMSYQSALRDEFMAEYNNLEQAVNAIPSSLGHRDEIPQEIVDYFVQSKVDGKYMPSVTSWLNKGLKYHNTKDNDLVKFPTALKLIQEYGDDCPIANYSMLGPHSVINRHTGIENRSGEYIRIHIPLIVPAGDIFFEVYGEEIDWSDIFGFNNQLPHSAWNNTDEWRLCFLIDIHRARAGLPPGLPYDKDLEINAEPFVRNGTQLGIKPDTSWFK